jgi:hypothetical protein
MTVPKIDMRVARTAVHSAANAMARDVTAISASSLLLLLLLFSSE